MYLFVPREISALNRSNTKQFIDELRVIVTALIPSSSRGDRWKGYVMAVGGGMDAPVQHPHSD